MALDIFFIEDIRNALLAANEASSATAAATSRDIHGLDLIAERLRRELPEDSRTLLNALHAAAISNVNTMRHYRQGYKAALATVALSFGLSPRIVAGEEANRIEG